MNTIQITNDNYEQEVINSSIPVIIDVYGENCTKCKIFEPTFRAISINEKYNNKIKFGMINSSKNKRLAINLKVLSQPQIIFLKNNQVVDRLMGQNLTKECLEEKLENLIK